MRRRIQIAGIAFIGVDVDFEDDLRGHPPALIFDLSPADIRHASTAPPSKFPRFGQFLARRYQQVAAVDGALVYVPRPAAK